MSFEMFLPVVLNGNRENDGMHDAKLSAASLAKSTKRGQIDINRRLKVEG